MTARAWVLNLDAELELAAGARYTPPSRVLRAMELPRERLARELPEGDVVLDRDPDEDARGLEGRCWCPTPRALGRLARAGATVPIAPPAAVLARANERGFAFAIDHLPGALRSEREEEVLAASAQGGRWILKRGLGFAGRGQRRIDAGAASEADRAWIRASLAEGAVYVEPRVEIQLEVGLHGLLHRDGSVERGRTTVQIIEQGVWRSSRVAQGELARGEEAALRLAFERVAEALGSIGYFGPFGIDAYRHGGGFCALGELNARYTMGWGVGMGGFR